MINRTEFIRLDGQAAHLLRTDTNRLVIVRVDFSRNAPDDLVEATRAFAAISKTNLRTTRDLMHTKYSPSHMMNDAELALALDMTEDAYGISRTTPRVVVQHAKGDRPDHFHAIWPLVDPDTGRAVRSQDNYLLDELIGRRLEIAFGETITPGPRMGQVIEILEERGMRAEADILRAHDAVGTGDRLDTASRQQAGRLQVDAALIGSRVYSAWCNARGDSAGFERAISAIGMRLAAGDKAVMVVLDEAGFSAPLGRMLRQHAKAAGKPLKLPEREIQGLFSGLPKLKDARLAGLAAATQQARDAVERELALFAQEAEADGDEVVRQRLLARRDEARKQTAAEFRDTLKARREAIQALYRRRDRIRRARVRRAFLAADVLGSAAMQDLAFVAVTAGVVLAGGGLGAAMVMGGIAMMALPSRERARTIAYHARLERAADADCHRLAWNDAYSQLKADQSQSRQKDAAAIAGLDGGSRLLAAYLAHHLIASDGEPPQRESLDLGRRVEQHLGADVAGAVRRGLHDGGGVETLRLLRACDPSSAVDRAAVEAFLEGRDMPGARKKGDEPGKSGVRQRSSRDVRRMGHHAARREGRER